MTGLIRGRVYGAVMAHVDGEKPYLVVSNNSRNNKLSNVLAVRITTSVKPPMKSVVELTGADAPLTGRVLCDDLIQLWPDEVSREWGAVSPATMSRVNEGLADALGLA